ncbi:MAG: hypothetical protein IKK05_04590 [Alistipes sp.]|nr:hypothetical protein [Alistipes sp.]
MKINKLFALLATAIMAVGCYEEFSYSDSSESYNDASFEEMYPDAVHITIAELKYAFVDKFGSLSKTGSNSGWNDTKYALIGEDIFEGHEVYIKGKVTTDDEEGNVYKSLFIQDETSGIELKLNNNVGVKYKKGYWVYVRLNGLYLGNYRMMLSLGGAPSESWNKAGEHKFYGNSNLELQNIIDQHVFLGENGGELRVGSYEDWVLAPTSIDIITVTPDNYIEVFKPYEIDYARVDETPNPQLGSTPILQQFEGKFYGKDVKFVDPSSGAENTRKMFELPQREVMFGRLIRFENLRCRYAGVESFKFDERGSILYGPVDKNGDGEYDLNESGYQILEPVKYKNAGLKSGTFENIYPSWLYTDPRPTVSKAWYKWAFKEEVTGRSLYGSVLFAYDMESTNCSSNGLYTLRTSGYSRFARRNICKDGEMATITAIYGIYSKESNYAGDSNDWASYQLTVSSINDIEFVNGDAALLTDAQVEALTSEDMKTVPWIDEEAGESEY